MQPSTWPCAFQSPTTRPSKPIWSRMMPVSRSRLPWTFSPAHPREARHDRLHAGLDRGRIAGAVNVAQLGGRGRIVALVAAVRGAAVADEMLGGGDDMAGAEEFGRARPALQALDHRAGIGADDLGILGEALIGAAPAVVADDGEGRREIPVDAGHRHLDRGHLADPADEVGIAHRAEADILREDGRADDIGVAVDGVDSPHHRNRAARRRDRSSRRPNKRRPEPAIPAPAHSRGRPGALLPPASTEPKR